MGDFVLAIVPEPDEGIRTIDNVYTLDTISLGDQSKAEYHQDDE